MKNKSKKSNDKDSLSEKSKKTDSIIPKINETLEHNIEPKNVFDKSTVPEMQVTPLKEEGELVTDLVGDIANVKANAGEETIGETLSYLKKPIIIGNHLEPPKKPIDEKTILKFIQNAKQKFSNLSKNLNESKAELENTKSRVNEINITIDTILNALPQNVKDAHKEELVSPTSALYFVAKYLGTNNESIVSLTSQIDQKVAQISGLQSDVKKFQADYECVEQSMRKYSTVIDFLISFVSKPQYADKLSRKDTQFLEDEKNGKLADLQGYARLLNLLSTFVDEDLARIEILESEDAKYKRMDVDYAKLQEAHKTTQTSLEASISENKKLIDDASKTSKFLGEVFEEFDKYIAEIEKSIE